MLSRDDILRANDLERLCVNVPEWGGDVYIRVMTGEERDRLIVKIDEMKHRGEGSKTFAPILLSLCLCDEQGGRLFDTQEVALLEQKSWVVIDRLADIAMDLNHLRTGEVEKLKGNSDAIPSTASGLDLP